MHLVLWTVAAKEDIKRMSLRASDVRRIVDAVDEQLTHEPQRATKHKKMIRPAESLPFEHVEPVWQLSVGEFRVFFDIAEQEAYEQGDELKRLVSVRAVRRKPAHKTTKEIL